jgi:hypothetical protein
LLSIADVFKICDVVWEEFQKAYPEDVEDIIKEGKEISDSCDCRFEECVQHLYTAFAKGKTAVASEDAAIAYIWLTRLALSSQIIFNRFEDKRPKENEEMSILN